LLPKTLYSYLPKVLYCYLPITILGGTASFFWIYDKNNPLTSNYFKSIIIGLVAAASIPLLLYLLSSNLLEKAKCNNLLYFVFGGYCLIFATFSKNFLQILGNRLLGDIAGLKNKVENQENVTDGLIRQNSDDNADSEIAYKVDESSLKANVIGNMITVFNDLKESKYQFRTLKGLEKTTGLEPNILKAVLKEFEGMGIIIKVQIKGVVYYTLINRNIKLLGSNI